MKNIAAKRKIFLIISAAAMVLVVLVAVVMGPSMGLELGGGTVGIYAYSTGTTLAPADFENTAEEYLGEDVTVQELDNLPTGMTQLVLTVAQGFTEDTQQGADGCLPGCGHRGIERQHRFPGSDWDAGDTVCHCGGAGWCVAATLYRPAL